MTFKPLFIKNSHSLQLYVRIYETLTAYNKTVVCLAGLTRNSKDFDGLAKRLSAQGMRVVTIDSRGRGKSDFARHSEDYNLANEARDVLDVLATLGIEKAAFIGTSRGGLILHLLAGMRPSIIESVVLNDIGPVIEPDGLLHIRSYLKTTPNPKDWAEATAIQKAIHGKAFSALNEIEWERHARAIYKEDAQKKILPDFDERITSTLDAIKHDTRLPALWPQFLGLSGMPMMVVRGENSKLLSVDTFQEMGRRHPNCHLITADGQGHAPILDIGDLPNKIIDFLTNN